MIDCKNLVYQYPGNTFTLRIPDLRIGASEKVAITGPSGAGKTTLLKLISGILQPTAGKIRVDGENVGMLTHKECQAFRIKKVGLVPQRFELLDYLTVKENVLLPFRVAGVLSPEYNVEDRANELLERVAISQHCERRPEQLSQGERQRVAICRGLVTNPKVILADEPTGNLDPENQEKTVDLLLEQADDIGATVVMVTHEPSLQPLFDRVLNLLDLREGK